MELLILALASAIVLVGAILMFIGQKLIKKTTVEEVNYTVDNNKIPTLEDANLNHIMVEIASIEGGAENLTIAQIKEVTKVLNDYVGDDILYNALRKSWLHKELKNRQDPGESEDEA